MRLMSGDLLVLAVEFIALAFFVTATIDFVIGLAQLWKSVALAPQPVPPLADPWDLDIPVGNDSCCHTVAMPAPKATGGQSLRAAIAPTPLLLLPPTPEAVQPPRPCRNACGRPSQAMCKGEVLSGGMPTAAST